MRCLSRSRSQPPPPSLHQPARTGLPNPALRLLFATALLAAAACGHSLESPGGRPREEPAAPAQDGEPELATPEEPLPPPPAPQPPLPPKLRPGGNAPSEEALPAIPATDEPPEAVFARRRRSPRGNKNGGEISGALLADAQCWSALAAGERPGQRSILGRLVQSRSRALV